MAPWSGRTGPLFVHAQAARSPFATPCFRPSSVLSYNIPCQPGLSLSLSPSQRRGRRLPQASFSGTSSDFSVRLGGSRFPPLASAQRGDASPTDNRQKSSSPWQLGLLALSLARVHLYIRLVTSFTLTLFLPLSLPHR